MEIPNPAKTPPVVAKKTKKKNDDKKQNMFSSVTVKLKGVSREEIWIKYENLKSFGIILIAIIYFLFFFLLFSSRYGGTDRSRGAGRLAGSPASRSDK